MLQNVLFIWFLITWAPAGKMKLDIFSRLLLSPQRVFLSLGILFFPSLTVQMRYQPSVHYFILKAYTEATSSAKQWSLSSQHGAEGGVNGTLGVNHVVGRRLCVTCGILAAVAPSVVRLPNLQMTFLTVGEP